MAEYSEYVENASLPSITLQLGVEFAVNTLAYFYIKKLIKIIPTVPLLLKNDGVEAYETMDNVIEIIMLVLIVELSPILKLKIERLYNTFF